MRRNNILAKPLVFTIVPGALISTTVEAVNSKLISFYGSKISGCINTKSSFYNENGRFSIPTGDNFWSCYGEVYDGYML